MMTTIAIAGALLPPSFGVVDASVEPLGTSLRCGGWGSPLSGCLSLPSTPSLGVSLLPPPGNGVSGESFSFAVKEVSSSGLLPSPWDCPLQALSLALTLPFVSARQGQGQLQGQG